MLQRAGRLWTCLPRLIHSIQPDGRLLFRSLAKAIAIISSTADDMQGVGVGFRVQDFGF